MAKGRVTRDANDEKRYEYIIKTRRVKHPGKQTIEFDMSSMVFDGSEQVEGTAIER